MTASLVIWFLLITFSLSAMILSIGAGLPLVHLLMTGLVSVGIALVAIFENVKLRREGANRTTVAASTARNMGFVYVWGAVAIAITYLFLLQWKEWWQFFLAFAVAGTLCLFYANTITRDQEAGRVDETVLGIGHKLTWVQLVGMVIAMVGMLIDGKMTRYLTPRYTDWAGQNIFFFGAMALALLSAYALWAARDDSTRTAKQH